MKMFYLTWLPKLKRNSMKRLCLGVVLLIFVLSSCRQQKDTHTPIASAYDYVLYSDELAEIMPDNLHGDDSLVFARNYINQWQHKKVVLHFAEKRLKEDQLDFTRQIEDYKNSLIIYEYQKRLVSQNLDTVVTDKEVQDYYDSHKQDFTLKKNIVQVVFLKIPKSDQKNIWQIKKLLKTYSAEDKVKLKDIAEHSATNYFLQDDVWLFFDDFIKEVPIKTYNQEAFLRNNRVVVENDSLYTYLVRINDFKIADSISPIGFESDRIRTIIINIRKLELIARIEKEIFEQAQKDGKIKVNL